MKCNSSKEYKQGGTADRIIRPCKSNLTGSNDFLRLKARQAAGQVASLLADSAGHLADGGDEQRAKRGANAEGVCGSAKHGANGFQPKGPDIWKMENK